MLKIFIEMQIVQSSRLYVEYILNFCFLRPIYWWRICSIVMNFTVVLSLPKIRHLFKVENTNEILPQCNQFLKQLGFQLPPFYTGDHHEFPPNSSNLGYSDDDDLVKCIVVSIIPSGQSSRFVFVFQERYDLYHVI